MILHNHPILHLLAGLIVTSVPPLMAHGAAPSPPPASSSENALSAETAGGEAGTPNRPGEPNADKEKDADKDKDAIGEAEKELLGMSLEELRHTPSTPTAPTTGPTTPTAELNTQSLETPVTTPTRSSQPVRRTACAVFVISNEMIRRSGARSIPEALRMAPGVNVARITSSTWAISIRGSNGRRSTKLLVQIDGRDVYTPVFSGVLWDQNRVLLEDVERIEVVRGPGASVWGANAVNGIISIVTKSAADTEGVYLEGGVGKEHRSFSGLRAGGQTGTIDYRIYGFHVDDDPGLSVTPGQRPLDPTRFGQGGFRLDWRPTSCDLLTLQGDFYGAKEDWRGAVSVAQALNSTPLTARGSNFVGRWTRQLDQETQWKVQMYYDHFSRFTDGASPMPVIQDTFDLDFQYQFKPHSHHDVVWGFGYRNYETSEDGDYPIQYDPPDQTYDIISYFAEDTVTLARDHLYVTFGCKFEHNTFTCFEYQPTVRVTWTPDERTSFWGAISRAVRTPSIAERNLVIEGGLLRGSKHLTSEELIAYEFGIRRQPSQDFYWSVAAFFNRYDRLIGVEPAIPPSETANNGRGDSYGFECVASYALTPYWRIAGNYSFLIEDFTYGPNGSPSLTMLDHSPRNQVYFHSGMDLSDNTTFDVMFRYVDSLLAVPKYLVMDVRYAWQPCPGLELSVVGRNLLEEDHLEFVPMQGSTEVQAGVYGMITWRR